MKLWVKLAMALSLAGTALAPAAAQDMGWSTIIPSVTGTDTLGLVLREEIGRAEARERTRPAPEAAAAGLRYKPSKARRVQNMARFVAKTRAVDAGNAADLERMFASGDIFDKLSTPMAELGLRVDDLADVYALWWITAWNATQGRNDNPSRAMCAAVRGQAARALGATPGIAGASDAAKQEFAEALLVQMLFVDVAVEQNKTKPERLRALAVAIRQGARGMALDLSAMKLTESGFVPAR
jgi:hypothetical protein